MVVGSAKVVTCTTKVLSSAFSATITNSLLLIISTVFIVGKASIAV